MLDKQNVERSPVLAVLLPKPCYERLSCSFTTLLPFRLTKVRKVWGSGQKNDIYQRISRYLEEEFYLPMTRKL